MQAEKQSAQPTPPTASPRPQSPLTIERADGTPGAPRLPPGNKTLRNVPCRLFQLGQCQAGRMCPFSHDVELARPATCKYFAKGGCKFGRRCTLLHVTPDGTIVNRPTEPNIALPSQLPQSDDSAGFWSIRELGHRKAVRPQMYNPSQLPPSPRNIRQVHLCDQCGTVFDGSEHASLCERAIEEAPKFVPDHPEESFHPQKRRLGPVVPTIRAAEPRDQLSNHLEQCEYLESSHSGIRRILESLKNGSEEDKSRKNQGKELEDSNTSGSSLDIRVGLTEKVAQEMYPPLLPWETRLLAIHPGNPDDPLIADLMVGILTNDESGLGSVSERRLIEFEALSYTWGKLVFTHSLICNSRPVPITPSLDEALRHLRLPNNKRYIWVDQLCINQSDVAEKALQISKLFKIFQRASRVTVWLGPEGQSIRSAVEFVKTRVALGRSWEEAFDSDAPVRGLPLPLSQQEGNYNVEVLVGLVDLFQRQWFRRAWCVQEIFAAKTIVVHCGSVTLSWNDILLARASLAHSAHLIRHLKLADVGEKELRSIQRMLSELPGVTAVTLMQDLRSIARPRLPVPTDENPMSHLLDILERCNHLLASDDRDRIFALHGIAVELAKNNPVALENGLYSEYIAVDYKQTASSLYQDLTKRVINNFRTLEPLYGRDFNAVDEHSNTLPCIQDLPLWSPDWRKYRHVLPKEIRHRRRKSCFHSGKPHDQYVQQNLNESGILKIMGIRLGTVTSPGRVCLREYPDHLQIDDMVLDPDAAVGWGCTVQHTKGFEYTKLRAAPGSALRCLHSPLGSSQWRVVGQPVKRDVLVVAFGGLAPLILRKEARNPESWMMVGYACSFLHVSSVDAADASASLWLNSRLEDRLSEILHYCGAHSFHTTQPLEERSAAISGVNALQLEDFILA